MYGSGQKCRNSLLKCISLFTYNVTTLAVTLLVQGVKRLPSEPRMAGDTCETLHMKHLLHGDTAATITNHVVATAGTTTWKVKHKHITAVNRLLVFCFCFFLESQVCFVIFIIPKYSSAGGWFMSYTNFLVSRSSSSSGLVAAAPCWKGAHACEIIPFIINCFNSFDEGTARIKHCQSTKKIKCSTFNLLWDQTQIKKKEKKKKT